MNKIDAYDMNPYSKALSLIWDRLKWDVRPESWRSQAKLKKWKGKFSGEKAIIMCNGPSLTESDFSLLENVFTFGLNKINLLFDVTDVRPSCIVSVNRFAIEQNSEFLNSTKLPLFIGSDGINYIESRENVNFVHTTGIRDFAKDCTKSLDAGYTVTYVALQLAYHMGFEEVALIGCDHDFQSEGEANKTVEAEGEDPNHFDPNYFSDGDNWQLPDIVQSEISYKMAKQVYERKGRKIYNASEDTELKIFDRIRLSEFVKK
jgi:hypothetical protein